MPDISKEDVNNPKPEQENPDSTKTKDAAATEGGKGGQTNNGAGGAQKPADSTHQGQTPRR